MEYCKKHGWEFACDTKDIQFCPVCTEEELGLIKAAVSKPAKPIKLENYGTYVIEVDAVLSDSVRTCIENRLRLQTRDRDIVFIILDGGMKLR